MSDRIALALIALSGSQFTRDDFGGGLWVRSAQLILVLTRNIVILFFILPVSSPFFMQSPSRIRGPD